MWLPEPSLGKLLPWFRRAQPPHNTTMLFIKWKTGTLTLGYTRAAGSEPLLRLDQSAE